MFVLAGGSSEVAAIELQIDKRSKVCFYERKSKSEYFTCN